MEQYYHNTDWDARIGCGIYNNLKEIETDAMRQEQYRFYDWDDATKWGAPEPVIEKYRKLWHEKAITSRDAQANTDKHLSHCTTCKQTFAHALKRITELQK